MVHFYFFVVESVEWVVFFAFLVFTVILLSFRLGRLWFRSHARNLVCNICWQTWLLRLMWSIFQILIKAYLRLWTCIPVFFRAMICISHRRHSWCDKRWRINSLKHIILLLLLMITKQILISSMVSILQNYLIFLHISMHHCIFLIYL